MSNFSLSVLYFCTIIWKVTSNTANKPNYYRTLNSSPLDFISWFQGQGGPKLGIKNLMQNTEQVSKDITNANFHT